MSWVIGFAFHLSVCYNKTQVSTLQSILKIIPDADLQLINPFLLFFFFDLNILAFLRAGMAK